MHLSTRGESQRRTNGGVRRKACSPNGERDPVRNGSVRRRLICLVNSPRWIEGTRGLSLGRGRGRRLGLLQAFVHQTRIGPSPDEIFTALRSVGRAASEAWEWYGVPPIGRASRSTPKLQVEPIETGLLLSNENFGQGQNRSRPNPEWEALRRRWARSPFLHGRSAHVDFRANVSECSEPMSTRKNLQQSHILLDRLLCITFAGPRIPHLL